jgi:ABC-2 type transport system permease protein
MNPYRVGALIVKDWKEVLKNQKALIPSIIVPAIFVIILPAAFIIFSTYGNILSLVQGDTTEFLKRFPDYLVPAGFDIRQKMIYAIIVYFFAPFFLIIPIMISSIAASNSFVGEKEKKTIEGLLYTPLTDKELVLGKILVSFIPSVCISWASFLAYGIVVNVLGFPVFGYVWFPNPSWILMMAFLVPVISFFSLVLIVAVSERSTDSWESQQISVVLLLPVIGLVVSQVAGVVYLNPVFVIIASAIFLVADIASYFIIVKKFNRERIISRLS